MTYLESVKFLLGNKSKHLAPLVLMFLLSSLVDLLGIGLIGGYIGIILDPQFIMRVQEMFPAFDYMNNFTHEETILTIGYILFTAFVVKFCLVIFINHRIFHFGYFEQAKIQKIMIFLDFLF